MATRLERHQRQENRNRMMVLVVVIGAIIIFFLTIGIPMFINLSSNVGKMLGGGAASEQGNDISFSDVEITDIPEATNSASLVIEGTVSNMDNLTIYLNGSDVKKLDVSGKSDFSAQIDGLKSGSNEVYASGARKGSKDLHETQKYTVDYSADKPTLEIESPTDGSSTPRDEITVSGKTNPNGDMTVKINGSPTVVGTGGTFSGTVRLKEGDNKITVNVTDNAGNSEEKSVNVKYEK